jgi:thiamine-monophosphate kinase
MMLAVSSDMLVCGTHFFADTDPYALGFKTLAVNLSDMAAMGANPRWATLAISLPAENKTWLSEFSKGFFSLAQQFQVELIGGDTTRGPLNLCLTIMGEVPYNQSLRRDGACVNDEIWVSGMLGDAALALAYLQGKIKLSGRHKTHCLNALHQPVPRIALGLNLRGIATSAIDISDGLLADLGHILDRSKVGAQIDLDKIPTSAALKSFIDQHHLSVSGGDDYELCFTAPNTYHDNILNIAKELNMQVTCIGKIIADPHHCLRNLAGEPINMESAGYVHF